MLFSVVVVFKTNTIPCWLFVVAFNVAVLLLMLLMSLCDCVVDCRLFVVLLGGCC